MPGFIVMAANKDEGVRVLSEGLQQTLVEASNDQASVFSDDDRPWVLLRPRPGSAACAPAKWTPAELERFIRAGVALTRSFKFGHR